MAESSSGNIPEKSSHSQILKWAEENTGGMYSFTLHILSADKKSKKTTPITRPRSCAAKPPSAVTAFTSACIPAPPPESEPAMIRTRPSEVIRGRWPRLIAGASWRPEPPAPSAPERSRGHHGRERCRLHGGPPPARGPASRRAGPWGQ